MGKGCLTVGEPGNERVIDFDKMFPELPAGNIYIALTSGVESTLVLHLLTEFYPERNIIPCTWRFGDRRPWEFNNARKMAGLFGLSDKHIEAGYTKSSAVMAKHITDPYLYFNRENLVFSNVRKNDRDFVAGFTGKNTTPLDPEIIKPEEQEYFLVTHNIHRPLLPLNKVQSIDIYYKLGIEDILPHTHTCQHYGDIECGKCFACLERIEAFLKLGKKDPTIYVDGLDAAVQHYRAFSKRR